VARDVTPSMAGRLVEAAHGPSSMPSPISDAVDNHLTRVQATAYEAMDPRRVGRAGLIVAEEVRVRSGPLAIALGVPPGDVSPTLVR
jgi:hypothetical protein